MSTTGILRVQIEHLAEVLEAKKALDSRTVAELNTSNVDIEEHYTEVEQVQKEHYDAVPTMKFNDARDFLDIAIVMVNKARASMYGALAIQYKDYKRIKDEISPLDMLLR
ncbi:hypothetical protein CEP51_014776 [Fusarium floridanum]|uniref:Uncharacterized protein n=1 Tax=Fusarium floridanum TaxID=1325733 RepID=A0A428PM30_9HYPO|nr:hypothetical protein CEP51_014776 [Fusarium floridanum]